MKNITLIFISLMAVFLYTSCQEHSHEKSLETNYIVTSPVKKDTMIIREYVCQIRSSQHIDLRALERGYLQNIYVDEGKFVKKGQLMFQIMPLIYQAELQKTQAEVNFAEIEYLNTKSLADSNIVSKNELALSKAKLDKAKAELFLAQTHLKFTEVIAPFDGIMDRFYVRLGSLIEEGELLSSLSDNSKMWVYFNVAEAEYLDFVIHKETNNDNSQVQLVMANNELFDQIGVVETIEADFDNETGNIAFRATFPNPKRILRHGETGKVLMPKTIKNAIIIPQKATFEILDKKYVFIVDEQGIVKTRKITIRNTMEDLFVVKEGLSENDKILLEGIRKVKENDRITFEYQDPNYVMTHLKVYVE
jgi:membrane fusion protein (multidrug efflux system)